MKLQHLHCQLQFSFIVCVLMYQFHSLMAAYSVWLATSQQQLQALWLALNLGFPFRILSCRFKEEKSFFLQSCETKSVMKKLGSRLHYGRVSSYSHLIAVALATKYMVSSERHCEKKWSWSQWPLQRVVLYCCKEWNLECHLLWSLP